MAPPSTALSRCITLVRSQLTSHCTPPCFLGETYAFSLRGVGAPPLAAAHVSLECVARERTTLRFDAFNVSAAGEPTTLAVSTDLASVSGAPTLAVPGARGEPKAESTAEYTLEVHPRISGLVQGSLRFTSADGRYLWFSVEIFVEPPPAERRIALAAPLRTATKVEIPISLKMPVSGEWPCHAGCAAAGDETDAQADARDAMDDADGAAIPDAVITAVTSATLAAAAAAATLATADTPATATTAKAHDAASTHNAGEPIVFEVRLEGEASLSHLIFPPCHQPHVSPRRIPHPIPLCDKQGLHGEAHVAVSDGGALYTLFFAPLVASESRGRVALIPPNP